MATFVFEDITAEQATGYSAAADSLSFQTQGATGALVSVAFSPSPEQVMVTMGGRSVAFGANVYGESGISFPNGSMLHIGSPNADAVAGTGLADGLYGGLGADVLDGGAGDDLLQGNQGADSLTGGEGDDVVYGGRDDDVIDIGRGVNFGQGNLGNDTVSAAVASGRNTILGGQGDDRIVGGDDADFLNGNLGSDSAAGGAGNDILRGEDGADTLDGGAGADVLDGGPGPDRFDFAAGSSGLTLEGADRIQGWSAEDRIDVPGAGGASAYYQIPTSTIGGGFDPYGGGGGIGVPAPMSFDQALNQSNVWMRGHSDSIITAQVDEGVAVFVDTNGDRLADLAILLTGASVFEVHGGLFV
jgi:Ca2+-binding RTX toxin-like protein